MINSSEKRNRQLAFELQNSHVCEKRSNDPFGGSLGPSSGKSFYFPKAGQTMEIQYPFQRR